MVELEVVLYALGEPPALFSRPPLRYDASWCVMMRASRGQKPVKRNAYYVKMKNEKVVYFVGIFDRKSGVL